MNTSCNHPTSIGHFAGSPARSQILRAGYGELARADESVRCAEQELLAAHLRFSVRTEPRPELVFQKVLALRAQRRLLIAQLGEELVAD